MSSRPRWQGVKEQRRAPEAIPEPSPCGSASKGSSRRVSVSSAAVKLSAARSTHSSSSRKAPAAAFSTPEMGQVAAAAAEKVRRKAVQWCLLGLYMCAVAVEPTTCHLPQENTFDDLCSDTLHYPPCPLSCVTQVAKGRLVLPALCSCRHGTSPLDPSYPQNCCSNCPLRGNAVAYEQLLTGMLAGVGLS
jgi:hypothetical protein